MPKLLQSGTFTAIALAIIAAIAAFPARAGTASADIDSVAGLMPLMTIECTAIKLGVWRVPIRSGGMTTYVDLADVQGAVPAVYFNTIGISQSLRAGHEAAPGVCTLTGSSAPDGTSLTLLNAPVLSPLAGDGTAIVGVGAPSGPPVPPEFQMISTTPIVISGGTSTFYLGGLLLIPGDITTGSYGGYKLPVTLTFDDGM